MATVTGLTKERMVEIENRCVVSGAVSLDGALTFTQRDGTTLQAGNVKGPKGDRGPAGVPVDSWPVGSIFMAAVPTNPELLLNGGTWVRWGQGRMPLSQDPNQSEFDSLEETGGAKTHTLTPSEMPNHNHSVNDPGHSHNNNATSRQLNAVDGGGLNMLRLGVGPNSTTSSGTGISIGSTGGGQSHNNMPPYIVCYMWKRVA